MNEKNLVVCDKDLRYAKGLGENISERGELDVRVQICTSLAQAREFLGNEKLHILLIDEAFSLSERQELCAEQTFVLTQARCEDLGEDEKEILKLQSAEQILNEVFGQYYEQTSTRFLKDKSRPKQRILTVYSPIHRIGKTSFALALGKELAKVERTLYLNLEEYPDVDERFLCAEGKNLGDLLYYMRQEEQDLGMRLSTIIKKVGEMDYVPPILNSIDLKEVPFSSWKQLLERILEEGVYETIVLDLSESIQGLLYLLKLSERIYMPVLEDRISERKLLQFERNLQAHHLTEILEKTKRFVAAEDMGACARQWIKEER